MEDHTLSKRVTAVKGLVENLIDDLVVNIEDLEGEREKLQDEVATLNAALAEATNKISELQKELNDRD